MLGLTCLFHNMLPSPQPFRAKVSLTTKGRQVSCCFIHLLSVESTIVDKTEHASFGTRLEGWHLCRSAKGTRRRKERESNPQGREARPGSSGVPSPVGLPFRFRCEAPVAGLEPAVGQTPLRLNRPIPATNSGTPDQQGQDGGDLNPRSRGPEPRGIPGFPTSCQSKRPAGVEPALPPWQGSRLPLHHGRFLMGWIVKDQEHRAGLEPTSPHYGCGVLATGRPVRSMSVGPVGIEPTSSG